MFNKILIANRGEIALRVINTCKEMNIKTVAVYSTADADSLHVKFADEAVCIGPPQSAESYLSIPKIISAAEITNSDAIHPGYGFLAENASFSKICEEHKIKFIGASEDMINKMGDKAVAKETMKKAGVPVIPGSDGVIDDFNNAKSIANKMGYPVMLKASAGGGGKGMRAVWNKTDLQKAWHEAKKEALAGFGNDDMYIEKLIEEPRHIEIQVVGDQYGNACHLSERDCSIQRRHQKLLEESPSPALDEHMRLKMGEAAVAAAKSINYEGAGTVEFLLDRQGNFYFMEMNTRIQVEHPVTEEVINYDLICEQIKVAAGIKISGKNYIPVLHAIECRINAEDSENNFMPCPGLITNIYKPGGHGIRVDTHVYTGYSIPPYYDSMIAKLITVAQTREEAISKMRRALSEFVLEGVKTTIPFHRKLMNNKKFNEGHYTTKFMEENNL
jgi:acetyl-CoA carboxylase biotin carboxylase subunit